MEPTSTATFQARVCTAEDWGTWRDLRLRSLADSPHAYGSTLEREQAYTDEVWRSRVAGWTDPAWRGRGVGRLILHTLRAWADERGLRLHLEVEAGNTGARRLYERYGFTATGDSRALRPGSTYSCDRMVLD